MRDFPFTQSTQQLVTPGDPGRHPAQCRRHQVLTCWPPQTWASRPKTGAPSELVPRQRPDGRLGLHSGRRPEAPSRGPGVSPAWLRPSARARCVPSLGAFAAQWPMLLPRRPLPGKPMKHVLTAPSGFRFVTGTLLSLPARAVLTRATLVVPARREKGNE